MKPEHKPNLFFWTLCSVPCGVSDRQGNHRGPPNPFKALCPTCGEEWLRCVPLPGSLYRPTWVFQSRRCPSCGLASTRGIDPSSNDPYDTLPFELLARELDIAYYNPTTYTSIPH